MKTEKLIIIVLLVFPFRLIAETRDTSATAFYFDAKLHLENMLTGKEVASYEEAIYYIENAWYNGRLSHASFQEVLDFHTDKIKGFVKIQEDRQRLNPTASLLETAEQKKENYQQAITNYSIYNYITKTALWLNTNHIVYHNPYTYSFNDPMGTADWKNTQVTHLLNEENGNCFALASLFKILSERLHSNAILCTAPGHIYIRHADDKGVFYNVELTSNSFPGTGTIETLTYTTNEATKNRIALRDLNLQQSIALCLVYLGKGYQYRFGTKDDEFILECAECALKYDPYNLNAMLLKSEFLEQKLTSKTKNIKEVQKEPKFQDYQKWIAHVYELGYREMPYEMKNILVKGWMKDTVIQVSQSNYTPKRLKNSTLQQTRYASLSWGLFDEEIHTKPLERYGNTVFDTKHRKVVAFLNDDILFNHYNFDPVVFAWNIDPLAHKYPGMSPYAFVANNPIMFFDKDGRELQLIGTANDLKGFQTAISVASKGQIELKISENGMSTLGIVGDQKLSSQNQKFYSTLNDVIGKESTTRVYIMGPESEGTKGAFLGGYENVSYPGIGKFGSLDYGDMEAMQKGTNGDLSVLGFVTHEVWENYQKQVVNPNADFTEAHKSAIDKQSDVDNVSNLSLKGDLKVNKDNSVSGKVQIKYTDGAGANHQTDVKVSKGSPTKIKTN